MPTGKPPLEDQSTASHLGPAHAQRLVAFLKGGHATFELPRGGTLLIGRGRDAQARLDDASVSRLHAAVHVDVSVRVEDLGSANGTRLDGRPLTPNRPEALPVGAVLEVGEVRLIACRRSPAQGAHDPMARVREIVERVAPSDLSIILVGETGAGKEVLAEQIHRRSHRSEGPLVRLNCAALADSLLESELFGHERGAFTGAGTAKPGLLETANGGTILLDEIGEMPAATQAKLLRVLENREVLPVGALRPRPIDVRFIVATHRDLDVLVVLGHFRQDLLFRLNGITIRVPPLRERASEVPSLAREFLAAALARTSKPPMTLSPEAELFLESYRWPGNVRELRQLIERAVLLCPGSTISVEHLIFGASGTGAAGNHTEKLEPSYAPPVVPTTNDLDAKRRSVAQAIERSGGNQTEAAKLLGISRRTLGGWLDDLGIARPRKTGRKPTP